MVARMGWFLPKIVGISQALEWVYSADILDAAEALRGGLVKAVLPPDQLLADTLRVPRRDVSLVSGHGAREKVVALTGLDDEEAARRLRRAGS